MTDEHLIRLVQETPPEDLSLDDLELLRRRAVESIEVREALVAHLQFEQVANDALGRMHVSVDQIFDRTATLRTPTATWLGRYWVWGALALMVAGGVALLANRAGDEAAVVAQGEGVAKPQAVDAAVGNDAAPADGNNNSLVPAAPVAQAKTPPAEPWLAAAAAPLRPFTQMCFEELPFPVTTEDQNQLRRWWQPARGNAQAVAAKKVIGLGLDRGLFTLRAPWPAGSVLRLSIADGDLYRLHFWHRTDGVSFNYYDRQGPAWAAYTTRRAAGSLLPSAMALAGSDSDRYRRCGRGTIDVRYQDGRLVLSRGDVLLLTAPLAGPPDSVVFDATEGRAILTGTAVVPSEPFPLTVPENGPSRLAETPAEVNWRPELPEGATLTPLEDGRIELSARNLPKGQPALVSTSLGESGLLEIDFEFEHADPGTGLYLSGVDGRPRFAIGFLESRRTRDRGFAFVRPHDDNLDLKLESRDGRGPPALAGSAMGGHPKQWLRLVLGAGTLKCFASADGVTWGRALDPPRGVDMSLTSVGLFCSPAKGERRIVLRHLAARRLSAIDAMAPAELRDRALALAEASDFKKWEASVSEQQPADTDAAAWRTACAIRTLHAGPRYDVARNLADLLVQTLGESRLAPAAQLEVLNELALVGDTWDSVSALRVSEQYERIGRACLAAGDRRPWSQVRKPLVESPLWTPTAINVLPTALLQTEILELVYAGAWDELRDTCRKVYFIAGRPNFDERRPADREPALRIVDWAEALAVRNRPQDGVLPPPVPASWRHPLIEQLGKEGYNVLAELEAALAGGAMKDACQIISSVTAEHVVGVLPNAQDPELLVSLPGAVALAMRSHPDLQRTMRDEFGPLGQLRLRQAIEEENPVAVEAIATQFYGTQASAAAHVWLGDRALSRGDFARAGGQYRAAADDASPAERVQILARQRLAAAMAGRDECQAPSEPIKLADTTLSPSDFERYIEQLKSLRTSRSDLPAMPKLAEAASRVPSVAEYEMETWGQLDGDVGREPTNSVRREIDGVGAQISTAFAPERMIVSNRFQVSAYQLSDGKRAWSSSLGGEQGKTHAWPLATMRPTIAGSRVFVRRLVATGPELAALDLATGKLLWRTARGETVASDPTVMADRVLALLVSPAQQEMLQLSLASYEPGTGRVLSQRPLAQFRDAWQRELSCQMTVVGDTILIVGGGCAIGCDLEGQLKWLRRETWLGGVADPRTIMGRPDAPIVTGDVAFVSQVGVPSVSCIDVRTGRLIWQRVVPDIDRVLGLSSGQLLVQTTSSITALARENGKINWRHDHAKPLEAQLCDASGELLVTQVDTSGKLPRPRLVWLDLSTGQERGAASLGVGQKEPIAFGPLVTHEGRVWAFTGALGKVATREIVELHANRADDPGSDADKPSADGANLP